MHQITYNIIIKYSNIQSEQLSEENFEEKDPISF